MKVRYLDKISALSAKYLFVGWSCIVFLFKTETKKNLLVWFILKPYLAIFVSFERKTKTPFRNIEISFPQQINQGRPEFPTDFRVFHIFCQKTRI